MRVHPGPRRPPARTRRRSPRAVRPAVLLAGALLVGALGTACAATTAGSPAPAAADPLDVGSPGTGVAADEPPALATSLTTATPTSTRRSGADVDPEPTAAARPTTSTPSTVAASSDPSTAPSPSGPTAAGWSVVPPAGLQGWQAVPADDVSQIWRSGNCMVVVSAPADVPAMTDERFARAHVRYATTAFAAQIDPAVTETGDVLSQETDPLRVSDPTRLEPPAIHLQLSGFRYEFPTIGVTDQTYSFVTQGGGQGLVVSTICSDADFASRYDAEIAPLIGDLGVDTGI